MKAGVYVGIGAIGGVGALARFGLDAAVSARAGRALPWGTLAVNLSGAFVLGVLAGAGVAGDALAVLGTGLIGAYTTYSTWMFESHRLAQDRRDALAVLNVALSAASGLAALEVGRLIGGII